MIGTILLVISFSPIFKWCWVNNLNTYCYINENLVLGYFKKYVVTPNLLD